MVRVIAVAAVLVVGAPSYVSAQCSMADKIALEAIDKAWGEATMKGDRAYLENFLSAGYTGLGGVQTIDKSTVIANALRDAAAASPTPGPAATSDHYQIACTSNTAVITHRTVFPAAAGSANAPGYSRAIHVLEKSGGQWKAVSSTAHPLADAGILTYMQLDRNEAVKNRNAVEWIRANYANNATEVHSRTGKIDTKSQALEYAANDKSVFESLQLSDLGVRVDGNMGIVTGVNHVKGKNAEGKAVELRARFTDTFVKKDGRWMLLASQRTTIQ